MGNGLIAFLLSLGAGTWVYSKLMRRSGGLTKDSIIASVVVGIVIFIIVLYALSFVPN